MQMIENNEEILDTAMKMILHAGDARLSMMGVYDLLEDKFPVTYLRLLSNLTILMDKDAASNSI